MNVVITGTSRGIGLALTEIALSKGHQVLAIARNPSESKELTSLQKNKSLTVLALDLSLPDAPKKLGQALTQLDQVDILINNAGVYEKGTTRNEFMKSFEVNSVVPFETTTAVAEKLKKSPHPRAVHISSLMGSITDNSSGGSYAYRASKTALNMINKCLSVDQPWLTTIVMHPGWVQTRMGGEQAPTSVATSAAGIWAVLEELKKTDSGKFLNYQGKYLPW